MIRWLRYALTSLLLSIAAVAYAQPDRPCILVLGIAQDGGYPHIGCSKACCQRAWATDSLHRYVVSLALIDPASKHWWLFEATPDIKEQLHYFQQLTGGTYRYLPDGIFLTHAHIGHYTGLMEFGKEAMSTTSLPVYTLPRMSRFLESNGPWSQLVSLSNIQLHTMPADSAVQLAPGICVIPFTVPHRDEFSETAGYKIAAGSRQYLFIPDINKWNLWNRSIIDEVKHADIALLDGTFYDNTELPGRNMSDIPHPMIKETMTLFDSVDNATKAKICFIHFNHTNPILWDKTAQERLQQAGYKIARQGAKL